MAKGIRNPKSALRFVAGFVDSKVKGTNIYEREWDVLLVLDACRYDLFEEFAPEHDSYSYFSSVDHIRSVASATPIWLPRTFGNAPSELVADTHYVSGAGQSERCLNEEDFHRIDHVWKYATDPDYGQTQPEAITDAAIDAIRTSSAERVVVHYPDPHAPFLHCIGKYDSRGIESGGTQNVWAGLEEGRFEKEEVWEDYGRNLLRVLDEVEVIVENTDGTVAVTSDHGNALGERGVYGHPRHTPITALRRVPWAKADGLGQDTYEVKGKQAMTTESGETSVEEHLEALGYKA